MQSDFDRLQLSQMKSLIGLLQKRQVGISKFVSDQWSLVEMLQEIDTHWKVDYFSLVNEIEDLYAAAVDQGKKEMDQKDIQTIDKVLEKMLILIESQ
ncbi:hypothetical protein [Bdellovibrio sp.]|uniref:hypothetical protein n=1 Tax=Bdellovibrio sp. TaxID=28201 RepID=UPI002F359CB2